MYIGALAPSAGFFWQTTPAQGLLESNVFSYFNIFTKEPYLEKLKYKSKLPFRAFTLSYDESI